MTTFDERSAMNELQEDKFFVLVIDEAGQPRRLQGPASYDKCVERVVAIVRSDKVTLDDDRVDLIDLNSGYDYPDGGGIYIIIGDPLK